MFGYIADDNRVIYRAKGMNDSTVAMCSNSMMALHVAEGLEASKVVDQTIDAHSHTIGLIRKWANDRNLIEGATSQAQTVKLFEEGGEVAAAVARGNRDALKDGIGDMVVVLVILAAQNGLTFEECVAAAYEEIKDRKGRMVDGVFIRES